jgi:hypothetical protein
LALAADGAKRRPQAGSAGEAGALGSLDRRYEVVRHVLAEAGIDAPDRDRWSAQVLTDDGRRRFVWEDMPTDDADYIDVATASVMEQQR